MFCVPECRACVTAGSCPKGELPAVAVAPKRVARPRRAATRPIMERASTEHIYLECGHVTTKDEQLFYSVWQRYKAQFYCEQCWKWRSVYVPPVPELAPAEPLF